MERHRAEWTVTDEVADEPLELSDLRTFLKQDEEEDNQLIEDLIRAAREQVENDTRRSLIKRTITAKFDEWPVEDCPNGHRRRTPAPKIILPKASPLLSVAKVEYVDLDGVTQELSTTIYVVVTGKMPGRIRLARNQTWPDVIDDEGVITVTYDVGYGDATQVPARFRTAISMLVAHWYANREAVDVSVGGTVNDLPKHYNAIINGLVVPRVY